MTKAEIQQEIQRLEQEMARAVSESTIGDQTVKFSNKDQLLKSINYFKSMLNDLDKSEDVSCRNSNAKQAISGRRFM